MSPVARSIVISFGEYPPMLTNGVTETGYAGAAAAAARSAARIAHWKLMLSPLAKSRGAQPPTLSGTLMRPCERRDCTWEAEALQVRARRRCRPLVTSK